MRISIAGVLLGLLLAVTIVRPGMAQEHVTLPGAVWAIVPPPDFRMATEPIAAFRHPAGAIILTQDTPKRTIKRSDLEVPPDQAAEMRVDELTEVTVDGKRGFLAIAYITKRQATTVVLMIEGEQTNGNIVAVIPDKAAGAVSVNDMRAAVLTAVERPKTIDERLTDLPFKLGGASGMRVASYVPGGFLLLTDGPRDDPEEVSDQSFAMLLTMDTGGETFNPMGDLGPMVQRIKQEYPDAQILSSQIFERPEGNIAEVRYERTTKTSQAIVGGVTWAKPLGNRAVVMICQHPRRDEAAFAKLQRLRDGLEAK